MNENSAFLPRPQRIEKKSGSFSLQKGLFRMAGKNLPDHALQQLTGAMREQGLKFELCDAARANLTLALDTQVKFPANVRQDVRDEGYRLEIGTDGIEIIARAQAGLFYGLQTLFQLFRQNARLPAMRITDWPELPMRGLHLMVGCVPPDINALKNLIRTLAAAKMNTLILEYDNRFPFERHPKIGSELAYTKDQLRETIALGKSHQLQIIPLLDSLGHAQQYLCHPEYKHLAEFPGSTNSMCPSNPKTLVFMKELWAEVLEVHSDCQYAHVTGDEVFYSQKFCQRCGPMIAAGRTSELFCSYYGDLTRWVLEQGRRPIMWADMLVNYPERLDLMPHELVIHDWHYWCMRGQERGAWDVGLSWGRGGIMTARNYPKLPADLRRRFGRYWVHPSRPGKFTPFPHIRFFQDQGFEVIGGPAVSSEEGNLPVPPFADRIDNAKYFAQALGKAGSLGLVNTCWTSINTFASGLHAILAGGDYSWNCAAVPASTFIETFERLYLGSKKEVLSKLAPAVDELNFPRARYIDGKEPQISAKLSGQLRQLHVPAWLEKNENLYADILRLDVKLAQLIAKCRGTLATVDALAIGKGKDHCLDFKAQMNIPLSDLIHKNANGFSDMAPGLKSIWGIPFRIVNSAGKSVPGAIGGYAQEHLKRPRRVYVPVDRKFSRLFFVHACAYAYPDTNVATYRMTLDNGESFELPVVVGKNIAGWSAAPAPLPAAVEAWHSPRFGEGGALLTAWMTWCDNPCPESKIRSLEVLSSGEKPGYGMLMAVTGREKVARSNVKPAKLAELEDNLNCYLAEMKTARQEFESVYRGVMREVDAHQTAAYISRFPLEKSISIYLEKVRALANADD